MMNYECRANDVRDPVQHGSGGLSAIEDRRRVDRFAVRGRFHASDDACRRRRPAQPRRRRLRALPPLGRMSPAARASAQQQLAVQSTAHRHRPVSPHQ